MTLHHPGIHYAHLTDSTPLSIHVVKVDPELCQVLPARALDNGIGRECLTSLAERRGALAALNGGYFFIGGSFDGKSQGALKIGSSWYGSPHIDCSSVAWNHTGKEVKMSRIGIVWSLSIDGMALPVDDLNMPLHAGRAVLYASALHSSTLSRPGTIELTLVDGKLVAISRRGNSPLPLQGYIYSIAANHPLASHTFHLGAPAEVHYRIALLDEEFHDAPAHADEVAFWQQCDYIMSGAPLLIQNGVPTREYSHDALKEFVMYAPHPRSAVGVTAEGEWLFVVVEGRQPKLSMGTDVYRLAAIMQSLGCVNALNLDGGSSCLMVIEGTLINQPIFNGIEGFAHELNQRRISDAFIVVPRE